VLIRVQGSILLDIMMLEEASRLETRRARVTMFPSTQPSMEIPVLSGSVSVSESGFDFRIDADTDPDTDPDGNDGLFPSKHERGGVTDGTRPGISG
jgi:hypothetical protein